MVEPLLYAFAGSCLATLLLLLFLPLFWRRAVRLTTRRLTERLPVSLTEIIATQDRLRAAHAVETRATERRAEAKLADAMRERIEAGKRIGQDLAQKAEIADFRARVTALEAAAAEARGDLEQASAQSRETATALETAQQERRAAERGREQALKEAATASTKANDLSIELAGVTAALAAARETERELETELARARAHEAELDALLGAETARVADAQAARVIAERRLAEETEGYVALRAEIARAGLALPSGGAEQPILIDLRRQLDDLADAILRAGGANAASPAHGDARPSPVLAAGQS